MLRAILFDMGGTLDSDGVDWLTRFQKFYEDADLRLGQRRIRDAFDYAERLAGADEAMRSAGLDDMIARHVARQLEHLNLTGHRSLEQGIVSGFASAVRRAAHVSVPALAELHGRNLRLGVVSNGCGNVARLCRELGFADFLSVIVDSTRVGIAKPDPEIYRYAARALGIDPPAVLMVGDSFARDIIPAKAVGMRTAWIHGNRPCPDRSLIDFELRSVAELPALISSEVPVA